MDNIDIGIRALDIQTGLYQYSDSILDLKISETILIGKAASLASHLRGIQVIEDYDALKVLASKLGISATELVTVLDILQEIGFIKIIGSSRKAQKIEVLITMFEDAYQLLGEKWKDDNPNEFENKIIQIVNELSKKSLTHEKLVEKYDMNNEDLDFLMQIGNVGGFIDVLKNSDEKIIYSPIYMEENPQKILEVLNEYKDSDVDRALDLLQAKPGLPITDLNNIENDVLLGLMSSNVFQTPAITASGGKVNFVFTPFTDFQDKEMLRQARNVVAAVRYGETFSKYSQLKNPELFLQMLLDRGYIGKTPHSDIDAQYGVLRDNGLGRIEEVETNRYRFYLADTDYAKDVVKLAQQIIVSQTSFDPSLKRGIIKEAWEERKNLSQYKFSEYIPNLCNIKNIKNFQQKKMLPQNSLAARKVNEALNKLFISGGEPDVF